MRLGDSRREAWNDNLHCVAVGEAVNCTNRFREAREEKVLITQQFPEKSQSSKKFVPAYSLTRLYSTAWTIVKRARTKATENLEDNIVEGWE